MRYGDSVMVIRSFYFALLRGVVLFFFFQHNKCKCNLGAFEREVMRYRGFWDGRQERVWKLESNSLMYNSYKSPGGWPYRGNNKN